MLKAVIFDFDGTLIQNLPLLVEVLNDYGKEHGIHIDDVEQHRNKTLQELIKEMGLPFHRIALLARRMKKEVRAKTSTTPFVPGMKSAMEALAKEFKIGIVTANTEENVKIILEREQLHADFIYANSTILGKNRLLNKLLREQQLTPADVIYVGDEVRDVEACKRAKLHIIAVTWGYNAREILESYQADYVVDSPDDLLRIIRDLR
ncbi:MAG: HAD-IA family hydrolase [archaeon]